MKKYIFIILLSLVSNLLYADYIIKSTQSIAVEYLVYPSSLTANDLLNIGNVLMTNCKIQRQPIARFESVYNSTWTVLNECHYTKTNFVIGSLSTRVIITIDAVYDYILKDLEANHKAIKLSTYYEMIYDDTITGKKNNSMVERTIHRNYTPTYSNKDWSLYIINTSSK